MAPKRLPAVHLTANVLALSVLVACLISRRGEVMLAGIVVFVVYCAVESWTLARHRRDLIG